MTATVETREIPSILSYNREKLIGSWFPTGYYGHSRAKARIDLSNYYRQLARPTPPSKYLDREKTEARNHQFSRHDNRFKLEADPIIRATESGFGRRKSPAKGRGEFNPHLLSWLPKTARNPSDLNETASKASFASIAESMPSFESSIYARDYRHGQPTREQAKQIQRETFQRYLSSQTRRLQIRQNERNSNVASCLVWNPGRVEKDSSPLPLVKNDQGQQMRNRSALDSRSMVNFYPKAPVAPMLPYPVTELYSKYL